MKYGKAAAAAALVLVCNVAGASAQNYGGAPSNFQSEAIEYFETRLVDPRGAQIRFQGRPYRVTADLRGVNDAPCWAVDITAKVRRRESGWTGYQRYTVIFYQGRAVALASDVRDVTKA